MRSILIEDNPQVRELIKSLLAIHCPEVTVVGEAESIEAGYGLLSNIQADLWLLDIELRDGTVFELLDRLDPALFERVGLVFLTAFGTYDYMIQAMHKSAVDYLLKPVDPAQLQLAVQKVQKEMSNRNLRSRLDELKILLAHTGASKPSLEKLPVTLSRGAIAYIPLREILYLEGVGNICLVHQLSDKPLSSFKSLGEYSDVLEKHNDFFRIHKKYLVNTSHITRYDPSEGTVWLTNGAKIGASRRGGQDLMAFFRAVLNR
jgi:two-component system LytT family response regulator